MITLKHLDGLAEKITAINDLVYQFDSDTERFRAAHDALVNASGCDDEVLKADEALRTLKFLYENTTVCQLMLARVNMLTKEFVKDMNGLIEAIDEMGKI